MSGSRLITQNQRREVINEIKRTSVRGVSSDVVSSLDGGHKPNMIYSSKGGSFVRNRQDRLMKASSAMYPPSPGYRNRSQSASSSTSSLHACGDGSRDSLNNISRSSSRNSLKSYEMPTAASSARQRSRSRSGSVTELHGETTSEKKKSPQTSKSRSSSKTESDLKMVSQVLSQSFTENSFASTRSVSRSSSKSSVKTATNLHKSNDMSKANSSVTKTANGDAMPSSENSRSNLQVASNDALLANSKTSSSSSQHMDSRATSTSTTAVLEYLNATLADYGTSGNSASEAANYSADSEGAVPQENTVSPSGESVFIYSHRVSRTSDSTNTTCSSGSEKDSELSSEGERHYDVNESRRESHASNENLRHGGIISRASSTSSKSKRRTKKSSKKRHRSPKVTKFQGDVKTVRQHIKPGTVDDLTQLFDESRVLEADTPIQRSQRDSRGESHDERCAFYEVSNSRNDVKENDEEIFDYISASKAIIEKAMLNRGSNLSIKSQESDDGVTNKTHAIVDNRGEDSKRNQESFDTSFQTHHVQLGSSGMEIGDNTSYQVDTIKSVNTSNAHAHSPNHGGADNVNEKEAVLGNESSFTTSVSTNSQEMISQRLRDTTHSMISGREQNVSEEFEWRKENDANAAGRKDEYLWESSSMGLTGPTRRHDDSLTGLASWSTSNDVENRDVTIHHWKDSSQKGPTVVIASILTPVVEMSENNAETGDETEYEISTVKTTYINNGSAFDQTDRTSYTTTNHDVTDGRKADSGTESELLLLRSKTERESRAEPADDVIAQLPTDLSSQTTGVNLFAQTTGLTPERGEGGRKDIVGSHVTDNEVGDENRKDGDEQSKNVAHRAVTVDRNTHLGQISTSPSSPFAQEGETDESHGQDKTNPKKKKKKKGVVGLDDFNAILSGLDLNTESDSNLAAPAYSWRDLSSSSEGSSSEYIDNDSDSMKREKKDNTKSFRQESDNNSGIAHVVVSRENDTKKDESVSDNGPDFVSSEDAHDSIDGEIRDLHMRFPPHTSENVVEETTYKLVQSVNSSHGSLSSGASTTYRENTAARETVFNSDFFGAREIREENTRDSPPTSPKAGVLHDGNKANDYQVTSVVPTPVFESDSSTTTSQNPSLTQRHLSVNRDETVVPSAIGGSYTVVDRVANERGRDSVQYDSGSSFSSKFTKEKYVYADNSTGSLLNKWAKESVENSSQEEFNEVTETFDISPPQEEYTETTETFNISPPQEEFKEVIETFDISPPQEEFNETTETFDISPPQEEFKEVLETFDISPQRENFNETTETFDISPPQEEFNDVLETFDISPQRENFNETTETFDISPPQEEFNEVLETFDISPQRENFNETTETFDISPPQEEFNEVTETFGISPPQEQVYEVTETFDILPSGNHVLKERKISSSDRWDSERSRKSSSSASSSLSDSDSEGFLGSSTTRNKWRNNGESKSFAVFTDRSSYEDGHGVNNRILIRQDHGKPRSIENDRAVIPVGKFATESRNSRNDFTKQKQTGDKYNKDMAAIVGEVSSFNIHRKVTSVEESATAPTDRASTSQIQTVPSERGGNSDIFLIQDKSGDVYALQEVGTTDNTGAQSVTTIHTANRNDYSSQQASIQPVSFSGSNSYSSELARADIHVDSAAVNDEKAREVITAYLNSGSGSNVNRPLNSNFNRGSSTYSQGIVNTDHSHQSDFTRGNTVGSVVINNTSKSNTASSPHSIIVHQGANQNDLLTNSTVTVNQEVNTKADTSQTWDIHGYEPYTTGGGGEQSYKTSLLVTNLNTPQQQSQLSFSNLPTSDTSFDSRQSNSFVNTTQRASAFQPLNVSVNQDQNVTPFTTRPVTVQTTTNAVVGEKVDMTIDFPQKGQTYIPQRITATADVGTSSSDDDSKNRYVVKGAPMKSALKKGSAYNSSNTSFDSNSDIFYTKKETHTGDIIIGGKKGGSSVFDTSRDSRHITTRSESLSPSSVDSSMYVMRQGSDRSRDASCKIQHHEVLETRHKQRSGIQKARKVGKSASKHHSPERIFKNPTLSLRKFDYDEKSASSDEETQNERYKTITRVVIDDGDVNKSRSSSSSPTNQYRVSNRASLNRSRDDSQSLDRKSYQIRTGNKSKGQKDSESGSFSEDESELEISQQRRQYKVVNNSNFMIDKNDVRAQSSPHPLTSSSKSIEEAVIHRTEKIQPSRFQTRPSSGRSHKTVIQLEVGDQIKEKSRYESGSDFSRDRMKRAKSMDNLATRRNYVRSHDLNASYGNIHSLSTARTRSADSTSDEQSSSDFEGNSPFNLSSSSSRLVKTSKQKKGSKTYVVNSTLDDKHQHPSGWYKSTIDINEDIPDTGSHNHNISLTKFKNTSTNESFSQRERMTQERQNSYTKEEKSMYYAKQESQPVSQHVTKFRVHPSPDSGQGTEVASSDGENEFHRQRTERVERSYEVKREPMLPEQFQDDEEVTKDLRVLRGKILIKNRLDSDYDLDDFDQNVNVFDSSFHTDKDNPLYSSDTDLQASLQREEEEELARQINQDITFEEVSRMASRQKSKKTLLNASSKPKKKQNLSTLLLSKLANVDSQDIRQTIDVQHHNEEIFGNIDFIHADGEHTDSQNTSNFDSVSEKVELTLQQGKAYVIIKVIAERIVPTDYEFNVWRKSQAIVTRQIEVDLLANEQRRRFYNHVMDTQGLPAAVEYYDDGRGNNDSLTSHEKQLSSLETLKLFSQILDVADGQGEQDHTSMSTKQEMGQLSGADLLY